PPSRDAQGTPRVFVSTGAARRDYIRPHETGTHDVRQEAAMATSTHAAESTTLSRPIHPGTRIGHVHLKVADLERALGFYCGVLGFELTQRYGRDAAFISAGGYPHHIGLNTWEGRGGRPPAPGTTGLFHLAILYPSRTALADALRRLIAAGIQLD